MADLNDSVQEGLSEIRTSILGAQILLGFQYQALFHKGFSAMPAARQALALAGYPLLVLVIVLMLAPASFHRLAERGEATPRQTRVTAVLMTVSLALFAVAVGLNVAMATLGELGRYGAVLGAAVAVLALVSWIGLEMIMRKPSRGEPPAGGRPTPLKEKVSQVLTETRIVLPGVQALLGFQLAGFLMEGFADFSAEAKAAHTAGLVLLLVSMVLLLAPAPFHRLAERGEPTERADRVGTGLVLAGQAILGLALAADLFVVVDVITGQTALAAAATGLAAAVALLLWFAWPLAARRS